MLVAPSVAKIEKPCGSTTGVGNGPAVAKRILLPKYKKDLNPLQLEIDTHKLIKKLNINFEETMIKGRLKTGRKN